MGQANWVLSPYSLNKLLIDTKICTSSISSSISVIKWCNIIIGYGDLNHFIHLFVSRSGQGKCKYFVKNTPQITLSVYKQQWTVTSKSIAGTLKKKNVILEYYKKHWWEQLGLSQTLAVTCPDGPYADLRPWLSDTNRRIIRRRTTPNIFL